MPEVAVAYMPIVPTTRGMQSALTRAVAPAATAAGVVAGGNMSRTMGSRLTSGLATSAKVAGAGMASVLGFSVVKGFQRLSAIENAEAKLKGLGNSGAATSEIMSNALASVKGTAFGMDEAATTAASAVAAGVKPGQELQKYLGLVGDAATIAGTDMGSMGSIFNKVMTSGKVQGDVFNQLADAGIPVVQMLAKEMGVSAEQVYALGAKGQISSDQFLAAMGQMEGAALSSGNTTTGAFKNMIAALSRLGAGLLKGIYPAIGPTFNKITALLDGLEGKVTPILTGISEKVGAALSHLDFSSWSAFTGSLGETGSALATSFAPALDKVRASFGALAPSIGEAGRQLPALGVASGTILAGGLKLAAGAVGFLADHMGTVGRVLPIILTAFAAWRVASMALAVSSQRLQWVQAMMAPVLLANNALRLTNIILENRQTQAKIAQTAATATETGAQTANNVAQQGGVFARMRAVAATVAHRVATVAASVAARAAAAAQWLLNAAMSANPIGLVVIALTALVAGLVLFFTKTQLGQQIWATVWGGIKAITAGFVAWFQTYVMPVLSGAVHALGAVFSWLYQNIIQPVWTGIKIAITLVAAALLTIFQGITWAVRSTLGPVFSWLYTSVIVPVWNGIRGAISAAWTFIRDAVFNPLIGFVRNTLVPTWNFLRLVVAQVWGGIRGAISAAWAFIRDAVLNPLIGFVRGALVNTWRFLQNVVGQVWGAIRGAVSAAWNFLRDSVFAPLMSHIRGPLTRTWDNFKTGVETIWRMIRTASSNAWNFLRDHVFSPISGGLDKLKTAFDKTQSGIATAWDKLRDAVKTPVAFVVNKVVNPFLTNYNKINDFWSGDDIATISGFAGGGVLPGYRSSKTDDVLTPMRSGEGVLVPEVVKGLGPSFVHGANRAGNRGGVAAVRKWVAEGFAKGGVISPVRGNPGLSQGYSRIHKGIDISVGEGTPVYATADGVVSHAGPGARAPGVWGGNEVHIRGGGLERWFAHLSQILVRPGEQVKQGQLIGKSGNTGISSGPHLHFGVFQGGWPNDVNPLDYLKGAIEFGPDSGGGFIDPGQWFMEKLAGAGFDWAKKIKEARDSFAGNKFVQMGTGLAGKVFDGIKQKAADLASPLLNAFDNAVAGGKRVVSGVANRAKVTAWMTEALRKKGQFSLGNLGSGVARALKESGGDPNITQQIHDVNSGGNEARGLMQVIPTTFRANMEPGHGNIWDPVDNILASINCTLRRYGSLRAGWDQPLGYARGGIVSDMWDAPAGTVHSLRPGVSSIYNGTGGTEYFQRVEPAASSSAAVRPLTVENVYAFDVDEALEKLDRNRRRVEALHV